MPRSSSSAACKGSSSPELATLVVVARTTSRETFGVPQPPLTMTVTATRVLATAESRRLTDVHPEAIGAASRPIACNTMAEGAGCYNRDVRRFVLVLVVGLLTVSASGAATVIVGEPCTGDEVAGEDDGGCPPTCVTCGCCAQAAEPAVDLIASTPDIVAKRADAIPTPFPKADPQPILHVPKLRA
jgi:hypothetical protein